MILSDISLQQEKDYSKLECLLDGNSIYFTLSHINSNISLVYDAFVVALIPLLLEKQENIVVQGTMDDVLCKQLNDVLIPRLCQVNKIAITLKVIPDVTENTIALNKQVNATGLSCGVDSLATVKYFFDNAIGLDYLTFFDAGSHGIYNGNYAKENYEYRLKNSERAATTIGLPLVKVKTNAHSFIRGSFESAHSFLNISCSLATLGLINNYHYASAYAVSQSNFKPGDTSNFDNFLLPLLFTSYFNTHSTLQTKTRLERISYIQHYDVANAYLDICTNSILAKKMNLQNCTSCDKCLRTAATLELYDSLPTFDKVFDLNIYHSKIDNYIAKLISKKVSIHEREFLDSWLKENKITTLQYWKAFKIIAKRVISRIGS